MTTERVDGIPVLLAQSDKMGVPEVLDTSFQPHGNWEGTSLGWTTTSRLTHILSEGDHRMNQVQPWVANRIQTLPRSSGQAVRDREWSDDRLSSVLDALSDDQKWQQFEAALTRQIVRVYNLKPKRVRVDSTTASGYWTVSKEGLFQLGSSKDHRPDLPPLKVMLSALDPLGLPVATQVVSGESAEDPLDSPAIEQVSQSLNEQGLLYVGDCKMAALETRAFVQANQDCYLCPLPSKQRPDAVLEEYLQPVWAGTQSLTMVTREQEASQPELIAEGYEQTVTLSTEVKGKTITWIERRLIVRSIQLANAAAEALHTRLVKAQAELEQLNEHKQGKKRYDDSPSLQQAAQALLKQHRVEGLLKVTIEEHLEERRVRAYGNRPAAVRVERAVRLSTAVDAHAVEEAIRRLGWRVYATNQARELLPLEQAVLAYRDEYLVERGFGRLKGKPLSLTPMSLQSDQRASDRPYPLAVDWLAPLDPAGVELPSTSG
ncbi:MAG: IS1634 family transposase [Chloroflexota bacterium]|nr:IS1634 family transposase [Chloroflexota bacterium]